MNESTAVDGGGQEGDKRASVRDLGAEVEAMGRAIEDHLALLRGERCSWPGCPPVGAVRCRRGLP
ncbi:hypothetical protein ACL02R_23330 [Streptomyces sp. MS19]|uniref:hypothetical protein n=1 Tax=Streptomyces sp. MS19 TaxID=3385972 RepID=UPI0039A056E7